MSNSGGRTPVKVKTKIDWTEALKSFGYIALWTLLLQIFKTPAFYGLRYAANPAIAELWAQFYPLFSLFLVTTLYIYVIDLQKQFPALSTNPKRDLIIGLSVGALLTGGTLGLFLLTDSLTFDRWVSVEGFFPWALAILLNVTTQEYILRGYLFSRIEKYFGAICAVVVSSAIFALFSPYVFPGGTLAILIAFAFNVLLSLLRIHTGGVLTPFIVHLMWSFLGILILGVIPVEYPSFATDIISGIGIFTGGDIRFAGSALTFIVLIVLIDLAFILISDAKKESNK